LKSANNAECPIEKLNRIRTKRILRRGIFNEDNEYEYKKLSKVKNSKSKKYGKDINKSLLTLSYKEE